MGFVRVVIEHSSNIKGKSLRCPPSSLKIISAFLPAVDKRGMTLDPWR